MMEAYPMWRDLERESGVELLYQCGLLYFGKGSDPNMRQVSSGLSSLNVSHRIFNPEECSKQLPGLRLASDEIGIFTPEAGWVPAGDSVRATLKLAESRGATVVWRRIESLEEVEAEFDAVVLVPGAWITRFVELDVRVTAQTFAYVEGTHEGPVWIEEGPRYAYGFPSEPGRNCWKVGAHNERIEVDPDNLDRPLSRATLDGTLEFARRRFGEGAPRIVESATCLYTLTESEDFRIGRVSEKTVFASACSGHGFKFGPWVGKTLADMAAGRNEVENLSRIWRSPKRLN
jgi:glycine/D-amino acid oxidase-like deaminating enzyme